MKKMNKVFALLLVLCLVAAALPLSASADGTLINSYLEITDLVWPVVGQAPSFTATVINNGYRVNTEEDDWPILDGVYWYDETHGAYMDNGKGVEGYSTVFEADCQYRVYVDVIAEDGFGFPVDENKKPVVTAGLYVDGNKLPGTVKATAFPDTSVDPAKEICISMGFKVKEGKVQLITEVPVTVTEPVGDAGADFSAMVAPGCGASVFDPGQMSSPNGVSWYDATAKEWLEPGDRFAVGHQYEVSVDVRADPGYAFLVNGDDTSGVLATINGVSATADQTINSPADELVIRASFIAGEKEKPANPFEDVPAGKYYTDAVLWAVSKAPPITSGTDATHFSPNNTCTRGQVVRFLWNYFGQPEPTITEHPFVDVKEDAYYYKAMLWAVEMGITKGTDETHFSPNDPCTRGQVVTFLWNTSDKTEYLTETPFVDVPANKYYYYPVQWALVNGVTSGTDATHFSPNNPCTRGQVVTFLYNAHKAGVYGK